MKNVHILPTDKPSRLWTDLNGNFYLHPFPTTLFFMQNIYITTDEEIKEGDWFLSTLNNKLDKCDDLIYEKNVNHSNWCKKIILTTDDQLIKDGVQAIGDEFLEWFVKNPSCEFVELDVDLSKHNGQFQTKYGWKIIIPQEEPKQENCCTPIGQIKRYVDCVGCDRKPEKLTVEEALLLVRNAPMTFVPNKRMYSEEEVLIILDKFLTSMIKGEKTGLLKQWFEQFKKK